MLELTRLYAKAQEEITRGRLDKAALAIEAATREILAIGAALRRGTGEVEAGGLRRRLRPEEVTAPQLDAARERLRNLREEVAARLRKTQGAREKVAASRKIGRKFRGRSAPEAWMLDRRG